MVRRDPANGEVLVAIMNDRHDFRVARDQHWYRVPIDSAEKWLKRRWPPQWVAFYQTSIFEDEKHAVTITRGFSMYMRRFGGSCFRTSHAPARGCDDTIS